MIFKYNSMSRPGFLIAQIVYVAIAMYVYKSMFLCLEDLTFRHSLAVLWTLVTAAAAIGFFAEQKSRRNGFSVFCNISIGFGIYTVLSYMRFRPVLVIAALCVTAAVLVLIAVLGVRERPSGGRHRAWFRRIYAGRMLWRSQAIVTIGLAVSMCVSGIGLIFGSGIMYAQKAPASGSGGTSQTISGNIKTLMRMEESKWNRLSAKERLDVLQTAADIERDSLGLPNELNVGTAALGETLAAYYDDQRHEIIIDTEELLDRDPASLLETVCHEAYHSYQKRCVDAWRTADNRLQSLYLYEDARAYESEFRDYKDAEDGYYEYASQRCEEDAEVYGRRKAAEYCEQINDAYGFHVIGEDDSDD